MITNVSTGVRVILSVAGVNLVFASNCTYSVTHNLAPIDVLDRVTAVEYAEIGYSCEFSFNQFRVAGKSAISIGIQPKLQNILSQPELSATLIDRVNGNTVMQIDRVKMRSRRGTVDARGLMSETFDFVGIVFSDEAGPNVDQPIPI